MLGLIVLTFVFVIVIILASLIFKDIGKKILSSLAFVCISIILFFVSFVVEGWEGIGLGAVSMSLFLSSVIALIVIVLLDQLNNKYHQY